MTQHHSDSEMHRHNGKGSIWSSLGSRLRVLNMKLIIILSIGILTHFASASSVLPIDYSVSSDSIIYPSENLENNQNRILYSDCINFENPSRFRCTIESISFTNNEHEAKHEHANTTCPVTEHLGGDWVLDKQHFPTKLEFIGNTSRIIFVWTETKKFTPGNRNNEDSWPVSRLKILVKDMANCSTVNLIVDDPNLFTMSDIIVYRDGFDLVSAIRDESIQLYRVNMTAYRSDGKKDDDPDLSDRSYYSVVPAEGFYPISTESAGTEFLVFTWFKDTIPIRFTLSHVQKKTEWFQVKLENYSKRLTPRFSMTHQLMTICGLQEPQPIILSALPSTTVRCERFKIGEKHANSALKITYSGAVIALDVLGVDQQKFITAVFTQNDDLTGALKADYQSSNSTLEADIFSENFKFESSSTMKHPILRIAKEFGSICVHLSYVIEFIDKGMQKNSLKYYKNCV